MPKKLITKEELETVFRIGTRGSLERLFRGCYWVTVENKVNTKKGYCRIRYNNYQLMYHRVLWTLTNGSILDESLSIDHIDGNKLNNSISNLRLVPQRTNCQNREAYRLKGKVGYCWDKRRGKWVTQIQLKGRSIFIGRYILETDAAEAYKIACNLLEINVDGVNFREVVNEVLNGKEIC